jgi:hypothetical protein
MARFSLKTLLQLTVLELLNYSIITDSLKNARSVVQRITAAAVGHHIDRFMH